MRFLVATPVFNGMPALQRCVGSVRGQIPARGAPAALTIQHRLQDGGSTDGSLGFLRACDAADAPDRYRLDWASGADDGMYDAINKAWSDADCDVCSWLNADEQYLPGTLERVQAYFEAHPDVDVVFGNAIIVDEAGQPCAARREIPLRHAYVANGFLYAFSCATFYRRRLWDQGLLRLDTRYRYSADMDLILRLLEQGAHIGHVNEYLSLFGVEDGRNLSFHPAMAEEVATIRKAHGGLASALLRRGVLLGRYLERMARGCYGRRPVAYQYAETAEPRYRQVQVDRLGSRFTYERFQKRQHRGKSSD